MKMKIQVRNILFLSVVFSIFFSCTKLKHKPSLGTEILDYQMEKDSADYSLNDNDIVKAFVIKYHDEEGFVAIDRHFERPRVLGGGEILLLFFSQH
jgi:hypothetical protein